MTQMTEVTSTTFDGLDFDQRLTAAQVYENAARDRLSVVYGRSGYTIQKGTFHEDVYQKTDCWLLIPGRKPLRMAIKARMNDRGMLEYERTDILVDLFDPFYGVGHPDTKIGRDMEYKYALYVSVIRERIRVARGPMAHDFASALWSELLATGKILRPRDGNRVSIKVLDSEVHKGAQIWLHWDKKTGRPKLLAFLPTSLFVTGKEIKFYDFPEGR